MAGPTINISYNTINAPGGGSAISIQGVYWQNWYNSPGYLNGCYSTITSEYNNFNSELGFTTTGDSQMNSEHDYFAGRQSDIVSGSGIAVTNPSNELNYARKL